MRPFGPEARRIGCSGFAVCTGSFSSSFTWMAGHFRSPDAPPLLMPDDWDESAPFGGKCSALNFNVRSRVQQAHVLADRVPDGQ